MTSKRIMVALFLFVIAVIILFPNSAFATIEKAKSKPPAQTEVKDEEIFIVEDSLWEKARIYKYVYSAGYEAWGVAFGELPIGTVIYAPFSGRGQFFFHSDEGFVEILLTNDSGEWQGEPEILSPGEKIWFFSLEDYELLAKATLGNWNFKVEEGNPMIKVIGNKELKVGGARLFIEPYLKSPPLITPKEYLKEVLMDPP